MVAEEPYFFSYVEFKSALYSWSWPWSYFPEFMSTFVFASSITSSTEQSLHVDSLHFCSELIELAHSVLHLPWELHLYVRPNPYSCKKFDPAHQAWTQCNVNMLRLCPKLAHQHFLHHLFHLEKQIMYVNPQVVVRLKLSLYSLWRRTSHLSFMVWIVRNPCIVLKT